MPHQCTSCDRVFPDGSKEMLSGCPDCGGNKFRFRPGSDDSSRDGSDTGDSSRDGRAAGEPAPQDSSPPGGGDSRPDRHTEAADDDSDAVEDRAQATARSDVVSSSELTAVGSTAPEVPDDRESAADPAAATRSTADRSSADRSTDDTPPGADSQEDDESPDLRRLRQELNDQFESIKILNPGQYELNLMELYDRDEYIISLREDGRYVIEVPDAWDAAADE